MYMSRKSYSQVKKKVYECLREGQKERDCIVHSFDVIGSGFTKPLSN